jgi:hypothetical protein
MIMRTRFTSAVATMHELRISAASTRRSSVVKLGIAFMPHDTA